MIEVLALQLSLYAGMSRQVEGKAIDWTQVVQIEVQDDFLKWDWGSINGKCTHMEYQEEIYTALPNSNVCLIGITIGD